MPFNINKINGKWIIGTDNKTTARNGLTDWSKLETKLIIPSVINDQFIEEIGYYAFYNCPIIEEVIIDDGIKQINQIAFAHCRNLKSVVIPPSVEFIGYCGIHSYNTTAADIHGSDAIQTSSKGTLVVTFLPDSRISFIGDFGISRKENIIIHYLGRMNPVHGSKPFGDKKASKVKIYSPFVHHFLGIKASCYKCTQQGKIRTINHFMIIAIIIFISS